MILENFSEKRLTLKLVVIFSISKTISFSKPVSKAPSYLMLGKLMEEQQQSGKIYLKGKADNLSVI